MSFNEKLQKLRKDSKMSQEQLADLLAVTRQSVSKWESGQTYPEMDKLLGICKIFNCTLEELTNDNLKVNLNKSEKKNYTAVLLDSFLDYINKTYNYFTRINFKDFVKLLLTGFVLFIFLKAIKMLMLSFFDQFNYLFLDKSKIMNFITILVIIISNVVYYVLSIFLVLYIFKIGFLDKKDTFQENIVKEENESNKEDKNIVEDKNEVNDTKNFTYKPKVISPLFKFLGSVIMFFIKIGLVFMIIPFIIFLIILGFALAVDFYLLFNSISFFGIFLLINFLIVLDILVIEYLYNVLNNKHNNYKRMFITLIVGILGVGLSSGLIVIEVSRVNILDDAPKAEIKLKEYSYDFNEDMFFLDENYYVVLNYIGDDTLNKKVNVKLWYYQNFNDVDLIKNNSEFYLSYMYKDVKEFKYLLKIVLSNLKENKFYDYSRLNYIRIDIITSENNIEIMKENREKFINNEGFNSENYLNDSLYKENEELNNIIQNQKAEIDGLKLEIDNYKAKLDEYKDKVASLLE